MITGPRKAIWPPRELTEKVPEIEDVPPEYHAVKSYPGTVNRVPSPITNPFTVRLVAVDAVTVSAVVSVPFTVLTFVKVFIPEPESQRL